MSGKTRTGLTVRRSQEGDLEEITEIYNDAVLNSTATFDSEAKSLREKGDWVEAHDSGNPVLVAVEKGKVVGWGSISPFSDRYCYGRTVEDSIYVRAGFRGRGIGKAILAALIGEAKKSGHHAIIGRIDGENEVSIRLHRSMGFKEVGVLREVGHKFGRWLDVVMMELVLD
jgi:phosphinothricin acetyltransferase